MITHRAKCTVKFETELFTGIATIDADSDMECIINPEIYFEELNGRICEFSGDDRFVRLDICDLIPSHVEDLERHVLELADGYWEFSRIEKDDCEEYKKWRD